MLSTHLDTQSLDLELVTRWSDQTLGWHGNPESQIWVEQRIPHTPVWCSCHVQQVLGWLSLTGYTLTHGSVRGVAQFLKRNHLVVLNSRPDYTLCPAGCASQRNFCNGISCQNGGTCVNRWNTYLCDCPLRFGGKNCEQGKNLSLSPRPRWCFWEGDTGYKQLRAARIKVQGLGPALSDVKTGDREAQKNKVAVGAHLSSWGSQMPLLTVAAD